jgi:hypothetical protein
MYCYIMREPDETVAAAKRELLRLLEAYPDDTGSLRKRLDHEPREGIDNDFYAAVTQLVLYDRLKIAGCTIVVDEQIAGNAPRFDFHVTAPSGEVCAVECTCVSTKRDWQDWNVSMDLLVDLVNGSLSSDHFLLRLWIHGSQPDQEEHESVLHALRELLQSCEAQLAGGQAPDENQHVLKLPSGAEVVFGFSQIDRPQETGQPRRIIALQNMAGGSVEGEHRLRSRLHKKYPARYEYEGPFVIAVGCAAPELGEESMKSALYGFQQLYIGAGGGHSEAGRDSSGFFSVTATGPRNTRISGMIVLTDIWKELFEPGQALVFYQNPHAWYPVDAAGLGAQRRFEVVGRDERTVTLAWVGKSK